MIGLGTVVNVIAIIAGAITGTVIKNGLPERIKVIIMQGIGLSVIVVGLSGTLQGVYRVAGTQLERQYIMTMIFSMVIGGVMGEILDIEGRLERMGAWFQERFSGNEGTFAQGFVTASLIYCVGAMAIVGSLEDGLTGNTSTLFSKAILDGVSAVIFAASMGIGVAFSSLPVFIYQGSITLLAGALKPLLTEAVVSQMSLVGGILIMSIGFNILEIKKIKVGNLLPAIFLPLLSYFFVSLF